MTELAGTLWVAGGGALGAYCRFQISAWFAAWLGKGFIVQTDQTKFEFIIFFAAGSESSKRGYCQNGRKCNS